MDNRVSKRNINIDFLRAFATIAVVFYHCGPSSTNTSIVNYQLIGIIFNWCVPIFVMITGSLLLNPNKTLDNGKIFKKYLLRILCVIFCWGMFYNVVSNFLIFGISLDSVLKSIKMVLIADTSYCYQFWYLYMLVGLYFLTPIIRPYIEKNLQNEKIDVWNKLIIIVAIVASIIIPEILNIFEINYTIWKGAFTAFSPFAIMFVFGYIIDRYEIPRWGIALLTGVVFVHFIGFAYAIINNRFSDVICFYGYDSVFTFAFSLLIFYLFKKLNFENVNGFIKKVVFEISDNSFGIYIIHVIILTIFNKIGFSSDRINPWIYPFLSVFLTVVICIIITKIIKKIPILRKLV